MIDPVHGAIDRVVSNKTFSQIKTKAEVPENSISTFTCPSAACNAKQHLGLAKIVHRCQVQSRQAAQMIWYPSVKFRTFQGRACSRQESQLHSCQGTHSAHDGLPRRLHHTKFSARTKCILMQAKRPSQLEHVTKTNSRAPARASTQHPPVRPQTAVINTCAISKVWRRRYIHAPYFQPHFAACQARSTPPRQGSPQQKLHLRTSF